MFRPVFPEPHMYDQVTTLPHYGRNRTPVQMLPSPAVKWAGLVTRVVIQWEWELFPLPCLKQLADTAKDFVVQLAMAWDEAYLSDSDDVPLPRSRWVKARRLRRIAPGLQSAPPPHGCDDSSSEEVEEVD